ncbi:MAG: response regulator [Deltaproteobacteria bacterium]|nr:response regulator [Deltaproteobacteria bacterium]
MADPKRILVVDDEDAVNIVLGELLRDAGYDVSIAMTCSEGISQMETGGFDLVITDKNLPDDSGMEIVRKARAMESGPEAVMITAYASLETAIEAMDLGARGYILKPFDDIKEVLSKVEKILAAADERRKMKNLIEQLRQSNEAAGERNK